MTDRNLYSHATSFHCNHSLYYMFTRLNNKITWKTVIQNKNSVLFRHLQDKHKDNSTPMFKISVMNTHKSALIQQISEAVYIANTPDDDPHQPQVRVGSPLLGTPESHEMRHPMRHPALSLTRCCLTASMIIKLTSLLV